MPRLKQGHRVNYYVPDEVIAAALAERDSLRGQEGLPVGRLVNSDNPHTYVCREGYWIESAPGRYIARPNQGLLWAAVYGQVGILGYAPAPVKETDKKTQIAAGVKTVREEARRAHEYAARTSTFESPFPEDFSYHPGEIKENPKVLKLRKRT